MAGLRGHPAATVGLWPLARAPRLFVGTIGALIALSWLGLALWTWSPYGRFLSHDESGEVSAFSDDYLGLLALFVAGWTLMTIAMMLPTSLPLVAFFRALVRERRHHNRLVALLVSGYLGVWIAFAVVVHAGDQGIHALVEQVGPLEANAWAIQSGTFVLAGLYQFTSLKYRCLDSCRSPAAFVLGRWRGRNANGESFRLGVQHGIFCLGCCWSLMLLMFAVGVGNIGWMLVLAAIMATEKNVSWGRRLSAPLGVVLLGSGLSLAAVGAVGGFGP